MKYDYYYITEDIPEDIVDSEAVPYILGYSEVFEKDTLIRLSRDTNREIEGFSPFTSSWITWLNPKYYKYKAYVEFLESSGFGIARVDVGKKISQIKMLQELNK